MRNLLSRLFSPPALQQQAHLAYVRVVEQSRAPFLYTDCAVPDTLDGRFDAIILHLWLVMHRLKDEASDDALRFQQFLQETFFTDMDRSIRELGSTDTGVGKRIKNMAQAFFGRLAAYDAAVDDSTALKQALIRNLYRETSPQDAALDTLMAYIRREQQRLAKCTADEILSAKF
ncbi:MAG: ubiquinol-cytochrome C chaperone family protein [Alphaproteobacteria bacterium]|nr:ubiquinol-cytochrome C chaperone family protein [Alphaproteobacteria bacterium]